MHVLIFCTRKCTVAGRQLAGLAGPVGTCGYNAFMPAMLDSIHVQALVHGLVTYHASKLR